MSESEPTQPATELRAAAPLEPPQPTLPSPLKGPARRSDTDSSVLKLKGLPYTTSEQQVLEFFSGYNVQEVAFVYEPDGRPSGLAFAEFASREEALQALSKNGEYLGDRYVRLLHVPKQEMEEQVRLGTLAIPGAQAKMRPRMIRGPHGTARPLDGMAAPPYSIGLPAAAAAAAVATDQMQAIHAGMLGHVQPGLPDLPGAYGIPPHSSLHGMPHSMPHSMPQQVLPHPLQPVMGLSVGPGAGMGAPGMLAHPNSSMLSSDPHMHQQPGAQPGLSAHMALAYQLSGMAISRGPPPRGPPPSGVGMGGVLLPPVVPHGGGYGAPGGGSEGLSSQIAAAGIDSDSKTVKIRGLPFRATALDIFNFFEGFSIAAETLQLGVDALGRPSGEAWLTFASAEEALRAVRERNRHYLGSRYLELSLT